MRLQPVLGLVPAPVLVVVPPIILVLALGLPVPLGVVLGVTMRPGILRLPRKQMMTVVAVKVVIVMVVTHPLQRMKKRN